MNIIQINEVAKEIAEVLEKHNVTAGNIESVLDQSKALILSSTPIRVK